MARRKSDRAPAPAIVAQHRRSESGAGMPRRRPVPLVVSEGVVLHCTGGKRPQDPADVPARLRRIYRAHTAPRRLDAQGRNLGGRGWADWGYHWAVDPWGHGWKMLGWGVVGRHAKTEGRSLNLRSHGIVVLGPGTELTQPEHAAILALVEEHDRRYGPGFVIGHRDVSRKSCPGPEVYRRVVPPLGRPLPG